MECIKSWYKPKETIFIIQGDRLPLDLIPKGTSHRIIKGWFSIIEEGNHLARLNRLECQVSTSRGKLERIKSLSPNNYKTPSSQNQISPRLINNEISSSTILCQSKLKDNRIKESKGACIKWENLWKLLEGISVHILKGIISSDSKSSYLRK